jgi:CBS domain containing-hemolysin-like protein
VAITYLSLVIGELARERLALNNPEKVASLVAGHVAAFALTAKVRIKKQESRIGIH